MARIIMKSPVWKRLLKQMYQDDARIVYISMAAILGMQLIMLSVMV